MNECEVRQVPLYQYCSLYITEEITHWLHLSILCLLFRKPVIWIMTRLFLAHLSWRLKCTIVITRCPSSILRPFIVHCPFVIVNFSHFRLLSNHGTEFDKTWQETRSQSPLPSLCFSGRSEKQDGRPGLWLAETFSSSPLIPLNGIQPKLTGSKILTSSKKFVFLGRSEKQDGRPGFWFAETFSTSPLEPLEARS